MNLNQSPHYDGQDNPSGCCPRFKPEGWDGQVLRFKDKPFVRARTRSLFHIPLNMGKVFSRTQKAIEAAQAQHLDQFLVLSEELSPWKADHYFAVEKAVPGQEMASLSGEFLTKLFEGPFEKAGAWHEALKAEVEKAGKKPGRSFFFYTTCPKCAKAYGKNYVVGVAELT